MKRLEISTRSTFSWSAALMALFFAVAFLLNLSADYRVARADGDVAFIAATIKQLATDPNDDKVKVSVSIKTLQPAPADIALTSGNGKLTRQNTALKAILTPSFAPAAAIPADKGTLQVSIERTGRVGLQWLLGNGKPRDGKAMQFFDTVAAPNAKGGTLTQTINWYGKSSLVTVTIQNKKGVLVGPIIVTKITPTPKPTPKLVSKQRVVGRRVQVRARLVVTNSDDGGWPKKDKIVEIKGWIQCNRKVEGGQRWSTDLLYEWTDIEHKATKGDEFGASMPPMLVYYSDPNSALVQIVGNMKDNDGIGSNQDMMLSVLQQINLLDALQTGKEIHIKKQDDGKSENAELYLRVVDLGEFGLTKQQIDVVKKRRP